jgi:hypothetical protein
MTRRTPSLFLIGLALCFGSLPVVAVAWQWNTEVVDTGGVGGYSSLAIDAADRIHVSYFAGTQGYLKYALFDGQGWSVEVVDDNYLTGHYTNIRLDAGDSPHIVYRYYSGHAIRWASRQGSPWVFSDVQDDPDMEASISMDLDSLGYPHVAYYDGYFTGEPHDLGYAFYDGSSWTSEVVDGVGDVGRGASIALDPMGHPHIAYYDETHADLKYAYHDGTSWTVTTLDDVEFIAFNFRTDIAVDAQGTAHIVYSAYHYQAGDWYGRLKYARVAGSDVRIMVVDEDTVPNRDYRVPAITLDGEGRPHVAYLLYYNTEPIDPDLKYAVLQGTEWVAEFVDTGNITDSAFSCSIALDSSGRPHISYNHGLTVLMHAWGSSASAAEETPAAGPQILLSPWMPNPTSGNSRLVLVLPRRQEITLDLLDAGGRRLLTLARGTFPEGRSVIRLTKRLPRGTYFARLLSGGETLARRIVIL